VSTEGDIEAWSDVDAVFTGPGAEAPELTAEPDAATPHKDARRISTIMAPG
jgi:hypothetical protein